MNDNGTLTLIPTSGLANRLRIMAVSIKLARESGKKLIIYWHPNSELQADFNALFKFPDYIVVRNIPFRFKVWINMTRYSKKIFGFDNWYLNQFKFDFIFRDAMAKLIWHNKMNIRQEVDKAKNVFICSCQEINHFDIEDYQLFKPQTLIQKKIEKLSINFKPDIIGIHIRSTDNTPSTINSPFELFIKKIEEELKSNPNATFFLATDNENYQTTLLQKFGNEKIIFNAKEFRRDVTDGIVDAVIDLFCLSKTSKIYGSYFSSFSEVAGRIGQIPVEVLKVN